MINATDFFDEASYWEAVDEEAAGPTTQAEADREYARNVGMDHPDRCWILSGRDVWYRNPFYVGPTTRHPEDDYGDDEIDTTRTVARAAWLSDDQQDIPF